MKLKRFLAILLVLATCLVAFAACKQPDQPKAPTAEDAIEYLKSAYKTDEGKATPAGYKLIATVPIEDTKFEVSWTVDHAEIKITLVDGLYEVEVPAKNETETAYTLTATVKAADGTTATKTFGRVLPVYDNSASVKDPVEGTAYKLYLVQASIGKTLFATAATSNDKYIKTDVDPKNGIDFYAEKVTGGYKFYTTINGVKNYVHAHTETADDGKVSKFISYATESDCVYYYVSNVNAWFVKCDNIEYVVGTYSSYDTICISESTYISADNTGVTQFPLALMDAKAAEELAPTEGPKDPTELSTFAQIEEVGKNVADGAQTPEKYLFKGVVDEIANTTYGNVYLKDEAGNRLYVYGLYDSTGDVRFDKMNPQPKVGDTLTVMGVVSVYKGDIQLKNAWVMDHVEGEGEPTPEPATPTELSTYAQIIEIGKNLSADTVEKYLFKGVVDEIKNTQFGNVYLKDEAGNRLYVYGLYDSTGDVGFDKMNPQPKVGDTVTVMGVVSVYKEEVQLKNAWVMDHVEGEGEPTPDKSDEGEGTTTPTTPAAGEEVETVAVDTAYYLRGVNSDGNIYFDGTVTKGRINAGAIDSAVAIKLEAGSEAGEYYIYFMDGDAKKYLAAVEDKSAGFDIIDSKDDTCVWLIDAAAKTIISKSLGDRGIATQVDSTYSNLSTYATSNFSDEQYATSWFVAAK